jgi:cell division protein FtsQ
MEGKVQKMSNIVKITKLQKKAKSHVGFLSFILVIAVICFLLTSPIFAIVSITVSGNVKISAEEIISTSGIAYGQNMMQIDKFSMINNISNIPYIEDIIIKRAWPNKVNMIVREKVPVSEVVFYGSKLLLDEEGYVLEVITDNLDTGFVKLEGISVRSITTGKKLECKEKEILEFYLEILKIFNNNDMLSKVEKLTIKDDNILVFLEKGHVTNLGDNENLQYKILLLKEIILRETNPAYIDLTDLNMIVTKPVWGMFDNNNQTNDSVRGEEIEE